MRESGEPESLGPEPAGAAIDLATLTQNPGGLLASLQAVADREPVSWHEDGYWLVTSYAEAVVVLRPRGELEACLGADLTRAAGYAETRPFGAGSSLEAMLEGSMDFLDPPDHTRLRHAAQPGLSRKHLESTADELAQALASSLIGALPFNKPFDFVAEFSGPFSLGLPATLLGLPDADSPMLRRWSAVMDEGENPLYMTTSGQVERSSQAISELSGYLKEHVRARREHPGSDLMSGLVLEQMRGSMTEDELLILLMEILAGTETVSALLTASIGVLAADPRHWQRLREEPGLMATAVEELLRYTSPAPFATRVALRPFQLRGRQIEQGQPLHVAVAAANRDPDEFPEPNLLILDRQPNRHLAFGGGIHRCLGEHVSRLAARVALSALTRQWRTVEVDHQHVELLTDRLGILGYGRFPVFATPAG